MDETTFITNAGHVGLVYRLTGVGYECLDHAQRGDVVHRYEAALRGLDEACRVYQYLSKRRVAPITPAPCAQRLAHEAVQRRAAYLNSLRDELYEFDLHLALLGDIGISSRRSAQISAAHLWPTHISPRSRSNTDVS